jgi:hypothetical protein
MPWGLHYPQAGEVYEAVSDYPVRYMTAWHVPYTGGGDGTLLTGERIRVAKTSEPEPLSVYAEPLRYDQLQRMIPVAIRVHPNYSNYYLWIPTLDLNRRFRLIETADPEHRREPASHYSSSASTT